MRDTRPAGGLPLSGKPPFRCFAFAAAGGYRAVRLRHIDNFPLHLQVLHQLLP